MVSRGLADLSMRRLYSTRHAPSPAFAMAADLSRRAEDANRKLVEALGHVYSVLSGSGPSGGDKWRENGDTTDGASSVKAAVSEVSAMAKRCTVIHVLRLSRISRSPDQ